MQLTQYNQYRAICEINLKLLTSGNGNFKVVRVETFRVGTVFVEHGKRVA